MVDGGGEGCAAVGGGGASAVATALALENKRVVRGVPGFHVVARAIGEVPIFSPTARRPLGQPAGDLAFRRSRRDGRHS